MKFEIYDTGIIKKATINLEKNELNIKYGLNGIGKSTIGKAIYYSVEEKDKINELLTYNSNIDPNVVIPKDVKSVFYFDQNYVKKYLFKNDIIRNSYEIIVKTDDYDKICSDIEGKLAKIKEIASGCLENDFDKDMSNFEKKFPITSKGEISKSKTAVIYNGFKEGANLMAHINEEINVYAKYLSSSKNFSWSNWFKDGLNYINDNECPFCCTALVDNFDFKKDILINEFESKKIKDNFEAKESFDHLKKYVNEGDVKKIDAIAESKSAPTSEDYGYIRQLFTSLNTEKNKVTNLMNLNAKELTKMLDGNGVELFLTENKLNSLVFQEFDISIINQISLLNQSIADLLSSLTDLKKDLGALKSSLSKSIKNAESFVNEFLIISGIPYQIQVKDNGGNNYQTILKEIKKGNTISSPENKLSFGEQNAISLILFAMEALSKEKDLIILDDPVSSFDETKKFAILHHLFKQCKNNNFFGKTVLMLTHDFSTLIDFKINGKPSKDNINSYFISNKNGIVIEKTIEHDNIKNSIQLEEDAIKSDGKDIITKLVHLRRLFELNKQKGMGYEMISSLFHLKEKPQVKISDKDYSDMDKDQLKVAYEEIHNKIASFNYAEIFKMINSNKYLRETFENASDFGKVNIARIYIEKNKEVECDNVLWKYLCESFHIENNYLFYLDYNEFDIVPNYILNYLENIMKVD